MDVPDAVGFSPSFTRSPTLLQTSVTFDEIKESKKPGDVTNERDNIQKRLATYQHWTGLALPIQLAVAGFVFTGHLDQVVCTFCGLKLYNWTQREKPLEVHRKYSPGCTFLKRWFPLGQEVTGSSTPTRGESGYDPAKAAHKEYVSVVKRVSSFVGWPLKGELHSSQNMSMAGFFYTGSADRVRCFYCSLSLRDWDVDDNPFSAHKQYSVHCDYINHIAQNAVSTRMRSLRSSEYSSQAPPIAGGEVGGMESVEPTLTTVEGTGRHSPSVQALLEFGYTLGVVEKAIKRHREKNGYDYKNSTDIFLAIEEIDN
ncbi:baculoviral IAP repeat-containing protein 3-like [Haliotis asinina]|uniref:baculoviral IAP repeat-containing protein 3-like n=1 Tax=Haliotis asinina TaxID=109174 RepID=UPI003532566F